MGITIESNTTYVGKDGDVTGIGDSEIRNKNAQFTLYIQELNNNPASLKNSKNLEDKARRGRINK